MKLIDQTKQAIDAIKDRLKTETDPDQRYGLAVYGNELNELYLSLSEGASNKVVKYQRCTKCRENKALSFYTPIVRYYNKQDGTRTKYTYMRKTCNQCTWIPKTHRYRKRKN